MQIVVLIAFVIVVGLDRRDLLRAPLWQIAVSGGVYLAGAAILARSAGSSADRSIGRHSSIGPVALRRHSALAAATRVWLLGGLAVLVVGGWGHWVQVSSGLGRVPLLGQLVTLLPFVLALLMTWALDYPFYWALRRQIAADCSNAGWAPWTLREYMDYNARHNLLFIAVPVSLIVLASDCLVLYVGPHLREGPAAQLAILCASGVAALGIFVIAPLLIVRIWRTARLPDGEMRSSLVEMCRRLKLRYRDILIWRSGGTIANAGVIGLLGPVRYILLSDALLERMHPRQIEAVFAHEAGHVIGHHVFYSALFAVGSAVLCGVVGEATALFGADDWVADSVAAVSLVAAWMFGFGWLSRRFERQSDVIAAWTSDPSGQGASDGRISPEGAAVFAGALQRIAQLNGICPHRRNWRHGSIHWRASYILWLGSTGGTRSHIDRQVRQIKAALWIVPATAIALAAAQAALQ